MGGTIMGLALLADIDESQLKDLETTGKLCSTCDPDVPGHVQRSKCPTCKGSGIEPCSFAGAAKETAESKTNEEKDKKFRGKGKKRPIGEEEDDDDAALYLEY
jgi:hypothetical protein